MDDWASPNAICDRTGFKVKMSDTVKQWDGARVRRQSVDRRNPQDFVRGVPDGRPVRDARPEAPDEAVGIITPNDL